MHEQEEAKEMLERIMKQNKEKKHKQARAEMMKEAKVRGQGQGSKPR